MEKMELKCHKLSLEWVVSIIVVTLNLSLHHESFHKLLFVIFYACHSLNSPTKIRLLA